MTCSGGASSVGRTAELGTLGSAGEAAAPTPVAGSIAFLSLSAGSGYTCGTTTGGRLLCWGGRTLVPTPVAGQ